MAGEDGVDTSKNGGAGTSGLVEGAVRKGERGELEGNGRMNQLKSAEGQADGDGVDGGACSRAADKTEKDLASSSPIGSVSSVPPSLRKDVEVVPKKYWGVSPVLIPSNAEDVTFKKNGKLWKVILHPGDANRTLIPRRGNLAKIRYRMWLANDPEKKVFDSSSLTEDDQEPVTLNIGEHQYIKAIDIGVGTMTKMGEKALFIAHYDYAFGRNSTKLMECSNVPNQSTICVEIELLDIEDGTTLKNRKESTVIREIVKVGGKEGGDEDAPKPFPLTNNSLMFIKLEGFKVISARGEVNEMGGVEVVEEEEVRFLEETVLPFTPCFNTWGFYSSGETKYPIPYSLGPLLKALRKGDKIIYTLIGESAFQNDLEVNGVKIKAEETVKFVVSVEEVEEIYDPFQMSLKEKGDFAERLLQKGMEYASNCWYEAAACKFTRVREYLWEAKDYLKKVPEDLGLRVDKLLYSALCGLAKMFWKLPEMTAKDAKGYCTDAIKTLEGMQKYEEKETTGKTEVDFTEAYRLRARLHGEVMKEYNLAKKDFAMVLELTEKQLSKLGLAIENMKTGQGQQEVNGSSSCEVDGFMADHQDKTKSLKTLKNQISEIESEMKNAEKLEIQEMKNYPFKYVPPK